MNTTQLTVFDTIKYSIASIRGELDNIAPEHIAKQTLSMSSQLIAVLISGVFIAINGLPFDNIKNKL